MHDMKSYDPLKNDKPTGEANKGEFNNSVIEMSNSNQQYPDSTESRANEPMEPHQLVFDFDKAHVKGIPSEGHGNSSEAHMRNGSRQVPDAELGDESGKQDASGQSPATDGISRNGRCPPVRNPIRFKIAHENNVKKSKRLAHRYCNSLNMGQIPIKDINPVGFASFLLTLRPNLQPVTWRQYVQQFKLFLEYQPHRENDKALSIVQKGCQTPPSSSAGTGNQSLMKTRIGGTGIVRVFPKSDFNALLNHFATNSKSYYRETLYHWLVAGITTGLRPIEWLTATIETSKDPGSPLGLRILLKVLHVTSADDRSRGIMRTIDISMFQRQTIRSVAAMVEFGAMCFEENSLSCCQKECQEKLHLACKYVFKNTGPNVGKNYSLLSLRHQFIANMKSLKEIGEVSALAGHMFAKSTKNNHATKMDAWPRKEILDIPTIASAPVFVGGQNHTEMTD